MIHQCLAYFFPAYCFSSLEHQKSVSNITIAALEELCNIYADLEKDENMTNPKQIAEMLADWNDPRKLTKTQASIRATPEELDLTAPGKLALKALTIVFIEEEGLLRKAMLTFVTRLYLNEADKSDLIEIKKQIIKINEVGAIADASWLGMLMLYTGKTVEITTCSKSIKQDCGDY